MSVGTAKRIYSEREESNSFEIFEKLELVATDTKKLIELFTIAGVFEKPVRTFKDLERAIAQLVLCKSLKEEILASELEGKKIFGTNWQNENSYVSVFKEISEWVYKYRQMAEQKKVTPRTIMKLDRVRGMDGGYDIFDEFSSSITRLEMSLGTLMDNLKTESEIIYDKSPDEVPFKHWLSKLDVWNKNTDRLVEWSDYYRRRTACAKTNALPLIDLIERDEIVAEDIVPCYQGNYADILLKYAFEFHPELANFNVNLHEKKVREFAELDGKMILWNREKIVADIYQSRPRLHGGASSNSSVGVILREVNRKRRHMPIRKLITATSDILLKIKPCFMMSPISVAQFLEPNCVKFDVVIFDEASQVKPEDALGAIARGTQLVVLGDTRQLPPTNFFDSIIDSDVEFEDEIDMGASDMESILHLCKKSYPTKTLNWHYRSRHESLIEVSNQEFYDNRLLIYPSPDYESDRLGLKFVHLPDAIYDRGISSINRLEAQEVAKFAIAHYRKNPDKSLGIGTFNIRQQQAIRDEIERLLEQDPNVEYSLYANEAEPFFVKNLETIQGDERDIILLSIGFGFDSTRKLSLNFGPLNQDGGERRLNVLITRAREKCVVFSNFKAKDLLIAASSPFGLRALKTFLQYAEDRNLIQNRPSGGDADSPFEEGVYECLRDEGFYVHKQVGCARYRIDMAIIDPDSPGRYVLGIECDGVTYHSSRVARERDRLRRQVLEGLGWRLYRVWSTDWYRNRKNAQDRLLKAVKTAVENKDCIISHVLEKGETKELVAEPQRKDNHTNGLTEEELFDSYSEVSNYKICTSIGISTWQELHEISPSDLSTVVSKIVQVEGPVHVDEVIRRIREHWDLKRSGSRIQNNVHNAIMIASRRGSVTKKGNFLYCPTDSTIRVRRRNDNLQLKIEQISDEEITEAVILVLRHQFSTPQNELAVPVSRLFGFKSTSSQIAEYIDRVVTKMLRMNHLTKNANGLIALKEQKNQLLMPSRPSCLESSFFIQFETVNR